MGINKVDMDLNIALFLKLVKLSISKDDASFIKIDNNPIDWKYIYNLSAINIVTSIVFPTIQKHKKILSIPEEIVNKWDKETKKFLLLEENKHYAMGKLLAEAKRNQIKLVVFKGLIVADLYPQYILRNAGDTDIFVYERDIKKTEALFEKLGYKKDEENSKPEVPVYINRDYFHIIELHYFLWEDYTGRKIDVLKNMNLVNEETLKAVTACDLQVTTLGYEEHLIYQMFHIIKHFSTQAVGIRYMADITLYINHFGEHIDFNNFWKKMDLLGFSKFCYTFLHLCNIYLGMKSDILDVVPYYDSPYASVLLMDMLKSGVIFEKKTSPWQILGIMTPYLVGEESIPASSFKRKIKVLFPSRKALPQKCEYAKKHAILLPIAWVHKMFDYIIRYIRYNKEYGDWYNANEKLSAADHRLKMMRNLGLVEKK